MSFDTYSTRGAICPHCEHMHKPEDDNYSLYSEDTDEWVCESCGEEFRVVVFVSHSWTTDPLESDE